MLKKMFLTMCVFTCLTQTCYCFEKKSEANNIYNLPNYSIDHSTITVKKLNYIKLNSEKDEKDKSFYFLKRLK